MKKQYSFSAVLACVLSFSVCLFAYPAVETDSDFDLWDSFIESVLQDDGMSDESRMEYYDRLVELHENPLNINSATTDQLLSIPVLDEYQVEKIEEYIYLHGRMTSLGELQLVDGIDYKTRRLLSLFVYPGDGRRKSDRTYTFKDVMRYGRSTLILKGEIPLYRRDGFKSHSAEVLSRYPNKEYIGNAFQHNLRYTFSWNDRIKFGFSADKDAGEPFIGTTAPVYDFLSAYFQLKDKGHLSNLLIGNIKASFGRGLVMNGGFGLGKNMMTDQYDRQPSALRPHSSVSETGYLTGIGSTLSFGHADITALFSYTGMDATLTADGYVSSIKTDGYHRTPLEISKRNNLHELLAALHAGWHHNGITAGATFSAVSFDRGFRWSGKSYLSPLSQDYLYWNAGVDYSIRRSGFSFSGETAICDNLSIATVNAFSLKLPGRYRLMLLYRDYSPRYNSFHGGSVAEGNLRNERGAYVGFSGRLKDIDVSAYFDCFHFPEPGSNVSEPSDGLDFQFQLSRNKRNSPDNWQARYRFKYKEQDSKTLSAVSGKSTGRLKLQWNRDISKKSSVQTRFDFVHTQFADSGFEKGFSIGGTYSVKTADDRFSASVSFSGFLTDSYNTSISVYEKGLLYSFNFITLYGKGLRGAAVVKYTITPSLTVMFKAGGTLFFDRDVIGSSQQLIDSCHKEDISLQLKYKF